LDPKPKGRDRHVVSVPEPPTPRGAELDEAIDAGPVERIRTLSASKQSAAEPASFGTPAALARCVPERAPLTVREASPKCRYLQSAGVRDG